MARINIDQEFFSDKRIERLALLTKETKVSAIGRVLQVWFRCYKNKTAELPAKELNIEAEWIGQGCYGEAMVDALLATRRPDGSFRIRGVDDRIHYLLEASDNGKKSAEARKKKNGTAQPQRIAPSKVPSGHLRELAEGSPKVVEGTLRVSEALSSSLSPHTSKKKEHLSTSYLNGEPSVSPTVKKVSLATDEGRAIAAVIGAYIDAWQEQYGADSRPDVGGRTRGLIKTILKDLTVEKVTTMLQVYCQMPDDWFKKKCHDFPTFYENLTKVGAALGSGKENPSEEDWVTWYNKQEAKKNGTAILPSTNG